MRIKSFIIGTDEAGRGPLAGPVSGAAVCMKNNTISSLIQDSKKLKEKQREELSEEIKKLALAYSICLIDEKTIDEINILQASRRAMKLAAEQVMENIRKQFPDAICRFYCLIDGNMNFSDSSNQEAIVKGDGIIKTIGAASILAKVERDHYMKSLAIKYPEYGFDIHKGYPTKYHREKIIEFGACEVHRKTFAGVKNI